MAMGDEPETGEGGPRPVLELVPSGLKSPSAQKRRLFSHMLALSTYVGHAKVTDTYWYITATPELLALAARRAQQVAGRQL
jgi:hypothetical protein